MQNETLEQVTNRLNNLDIHDLRCLARGCGVQSPTTKKKQELVESILKVCQGEQTPVENKMGRKPLSKNFQYNYETSYSSYSWLNAPICDYNAKPEILEGAVVIEPDIPPILRIIQESGQMINIPLTKRDITDNDIKRGDILTISARPLVNAYGYQIDNILKINGINIEEYNRNLFFSLPTMPNNFDKIELDCNKYKNIAPYDIFKGTSNFFWCPESTDIRKFALDFCKELKNPELNMIMINANSNMPSGITTDGKIEIYDLNIDDEYSKSYETLKLITEKVKNMVVYEKQVLLIITEFSEIFKIINYNIKGQVTDDISPETLTTMKRIISLGKYVAPGQNSTLMAFDTLHTSKTYKTAIINELLPRIINVAPESLRDM